MSATLARVARVASVIALFGLAGCKLDVGDATTPKNLIGAAPATQSVTTGTSTKISVFVLNQYGEPLNAIPVTFAIASGSGTLDATTVSTAPTGLAEATYTATKAGTSIVNVSVSGLRGIAFAVIATD